MSFTNLSSDRAVRAVDRQKLKRYATKWKDSKMILASAMFHDLLRPCAILSKALQDDELCVIDAIEALLNTSKAMEKLILLPFGELPTVKKVMSKVQDTEEGTTYQGVLVVRYHQVIAFCRSHKNQYLESILECIKDRVKVQHSELLTDILTILATHGLERSEGIDFADEALDNVCAQFATPLQKVGIEITVIKDEWAEMVDYARQYLNLVQEKCLVIWWKIFNCTSLKNWTNILGLIELLFCLPMSNGHLEHVFSTLKLIKSDHRSALGEDTLGNLLRIVVDAPPLSQ